MDVVLSKEALQRGIRAFSDQQIVTGIALLVAGFSRLLGDKTGNMSAYHWHTVIYLAWMSSNVHLSTLTLLRDPFRKASFVRTWRLVGMCLLFLGLFIALLPTVFVPFNDAVFIYLGKGHESHPVESFNGLQWPGAKAACFWLWHRDFWGEYWDGRQHPAANYGALFSYLLLIVSYGYYGFGLFHDKFKFLAWHLRWRWQKSLETRLRNKLVDHMPEDVREWGFWQYEIHLTIITFYVFCVVVADLVISFAGALWALAIGLVWGTLNVLVPWAYVNLRFFPVYQEQMQTEAESAWGFGQIMQVVFLALPILTFLEPFLGKTFFAQSASKSSIPKRFTYKSQRWSCVRKQSLQ